MLYFQCITHRVRHVKEDSYFLIYSHRHSSWCHDFCRALPRPFLRIAELLWGMVVFSIVGFIDCYRHCMDHQAEDEAMADSSASCLIHRYPCRSFPDTHHLKAGTHPSEIWRTHERVLRGTDRIRNENKASSVHHQAQCL